MRDRRLFLNFHNCLMLVIIVLFAILPFPDIFHDQKIISMETMSPVIYAIYMIIAVGVFGSRFFIRNPRRQMIIDSIFMIALFALYMPIIINVMSALLFIGLFVFLGCVVYSVFMGLWNPTHPEKFNTLYESCIGTNFAFGPAFFLTVIVTLLGLILLSHTLYYFYKTSKQPKVPLQ